MLDETADDAAAAVLARWDGRMAIDRWTAEDVPEDAADREAAFRHRCAVALRAEGAGWTALVGLDERLRVDQADSAASGSVLAALAAGAAAGRTCVRATTRTCGAAESPPGEWTPASRGR